MTFRARLRQDEGSILLSFMALFIISGLLIAVAATVISGEKQDRFDRSFERALLLAETGHSRISSLVQSNPGMTPEQLASAAAPTFTTDATGGVAGVTTAPMRATDAEGRYAVTATKSVTQVRPMTIIRWKVTASGVANDGRTRRIESELVVRPLFGLAAFGKKLMRLNGANGADSFYSTEGTGSAPQNTDICLLGSGAIYASLGTPTLGVDASLVKVNMCDPANRGFGIVATNEVLDLQGQVPTDVDLMEVHNAMTNVVDPLPTATGVCSGPVQACADQLAAGRLSYYREPLELPESKVCDLGPSSTSTNYGSGAVFGGSVYDVGNLVLDGTTRFTGTTLQPTVLCVRGNMTVRAQHLVNFQLDPSGRWVPRRPGTLLIFVTGGANSTVSLETHSAISMALYAPNNSVSCGSAGNVFGSMVANNIDCQGNFRFHYDQALGESLTYPVVRAENWAEIS